MRRFAVGMVGPVFSLAFLALGLGSCAPASCACSSPPSAGTPPPVTAEEAAANVERLAGVTGTTAELAGDLNGRLMYRVTGSGVVAYVDAVSAAVVEVVFPDSLPNTPAASVTEAQARAAAEAFLRRTGLDTSSLAESSELLQRAGVAAHSVEWREPGGTGSPRFVIDVNAASGTVFAYEDLRVPLSLTLPTVGRTRATQLALAAITTPGEQILSAELTTAFATSGQEWTWTVGLGVPTATQSDVYEHGAVVSIDAVTGETTITKS